MSLGRVWSWAWRIIAGILVVALLITLPLLALLGNDAGSRWIVERALGLQTAVTLQVEGGDLLNGMDVSHVHLKGKKFDLYINRLVARWTLVSLLRTQFTVDDLYVEKLKLSLKGEPSNEPVNLPRLVLPFRLVIENAVFKELGIEKNGKYSGLDEASIRLRWRGSQLRVRHLMLAHPQGRIELEGRARLIGQYDIDASGRANLKVLSDQGLDPIKFMIGRNLGSLGIDLRSEGVLPAHVKGTLQTLTPNLPFAATAQWGAFSSPWLKAQGLSSEKGEAQVIGNLKAIKTSGVADLSGVNVPKGTYQWSATTDFKRVDIADFKFKGLGGNAQLKGDVQLGKRLIWNASGRVNNLDFSKKWPQLAIALPPLTGDLASRGNTTEKGSTAFAQVKLNNAEQWVANVKSSSWPWNIKAQQQATVEWQGVNRQLPGLGKTFTESGRLHIDGSWQRYVADIDAHLRSDAVPDGKWKIKASGAKADLAVQSAHYKGEIGEAAFEGNLRFLSGVNFQGDITATELKTAWLLPEWAGTFTGKARGSGVWSNKKRQITLQEVDIKGDLREQALQAVGGIAIDMPINAKAWPRFNANALEITWGENHLLANGGLSDEWNLALDANLPNIGLLDQRISGVLVGNIVLSGTEKLPTALVDIKGADLNGFNASIKEVTVAGRVAELGFVDGQLTIDASNIAYANQVINSAGLVVSGRREDHELTWLLRNEQMSLQGRLHGAVDLDTLDWSGALEAGQFDLPDMAWALQSPATLNWVAADKTAQVGTHCWVSGKASLCNEETLVAGPAGFAKLRLNGLDAEQLKDVLPEGMVWGGSVVGNVDARWAEGEKPSLAANLISQAGYFELERDDGTPFNLDYQLISLQAFVEPQEWRLRFDIQSADMGSGYLDAQIDPNNEAKALEGVAALQGLRVDILQPFLPTFSTVTGAVSLDGRIGGTLNKPEYAGNIQLNNGHLVGRDIPINFKDITLRADVLESLANINGSFLSGQGKADIKGQAQWADSWSLDLNLTGKNLDIEQAPLVVAKIDPDLKLKMVPENINVTGRVRVPAAQITVESLPERAVPLSNDIQIVATAEQTKRAQLKAANNNWAINADVEVILGEDVRFEGFGVNGRLLGAVRLQQQGKRGLQAMGEVQLDEKDARYDAYGQKLDIKRGRLLFAGALTQPGVDIEASKEVDGNVVGIRVDGRANAPAVTFFSDGSLSQEEIISYLVLGRPLYTDGQFNQPEGGNNNLALAMAALKFGTKGGSEDLTSQVGGIFGIEDLALDAEGSGDETQFTVSGYINPKLYLSYGVGVFTPVNTVKVRYTINRSLYLQAASSLENAIDVYYSFKF